MYQSDLSVYPLKVIAKHLHHCRHRLFSCIENEVNEVQTRSHNGICMHAVFDTVRECFSNRACEKWM